jgi:hypothetical protein
VVAVAPSNWFGGIYKDDKPENFFAQFGTDPEEFSRSSPTSRFPPINSPPGNAIARECVVDRYWPRNMAGSWVIASSSKEPFIPWTSN